jgi:hypothetical protein
MFYARLLEVLADWLRTGHFPREELRVRPAIAVPFAVIVLILAIALLIHAQGG